MMSARCTHDTRTMPVRLYMSHGHREATVRTSCGARTVIVGIARVSCDFLGCKNITKSYGDRTATVLQPYDNRAVCDRRPYDAAYDGFTGYDAYDES